MVSVDEAIGLVMDLPDVTVGSSYRNRAWMVEGKAFAWERPFSKADLRRFGDSPAPKGPIFAFRVADLRAKEAILAQGTSGVFTIPHFEGYAAVLVQLDVVTKSALKRLVTDAWLACVPASMAGDYRVRARKPRR
jgi:hypothetical protein